MLKNIFWNIPYINRLIKYFTNNDLPRCKTHDFIKDANTMAQED